MFRRDPCRWILGILSALLLLALLAGAQDPSIPDWENPAVFERNQEETHVPLVPYASLPQALEDQRGLSPYYRSLNGNWKFHWAENPSVAPAGFFAPDFDDQGWPEIRVPSNWQMEGFGYALFRNIAHPFKSDPPRVPRHYNETGSYRRHFTLPADWADRQTFLLFDGVHSASTVWVNGLEIGYNEGGMEPAEYNITSCVRPGDNLLAVRVLRYSDGSYLEDQDMWRLSGIFRDVHLFSVPALHIRDYTIRTDLDAAYSDALLRIGCRIRNYSSQAQRGFALRAQLYNPERRPALTGPLVISNLDRPAGAESETVLTASIENPAKWSAESPNLYRLTLELLDAEGRPTEILTSRFGFREIEVQEGAILVNGVAVKLNGVNSHMQHPRLGHAMDRETILRDLILMKQFNINCVRTSHYPPEPLYLDLSDELGMYIVDEVGDECHATEYLSSDPAWKEMFLERGRRLVERDKNHPSVILWSAGNEAGPGPHIAAIIDQGKKQDPSRPAWLYGGNQEPLPFEDIIGPRYPTPDELERMAQEPKEKDIRPSFMDEYCAATGNSLGHLQEFWDLIFNYRRLTGGAVWDWPSPGIQARRVVTPDLGPYHIDGTLMGRPRLVSGKFGNAVSLSGHDDWVELYQHPALDISGQGITLEAWVFPRQWNGTGTFITKGAQQFALQQTDATKWEFSIYDRSRVSLESAVPPHWEGQWHHLAASYDGTRLRLYLNGALVGTREHVGRIGNTHYPVNLGKNAELHGQEHAGELCNSMLDEVRIYDRPRTAEQIREDMNRTGVRGAILYLPFEAAEDRGEYYSLGIGGRSYGLVWPDRTPQPELWQLKKSPQPVQVRPVDPLQGRVEITNRYHFTNLNRLRTTWTLQADDRTLQTGETVLDLPPGQKREISLPHAIPKVEPGTEYRLLVRFLLREDQPWAPAGHEVAFEQLDMPYAQPVRPPMPTGDPADLKIEESPTAIQVGWREGAYTFDRKSGRLSRAVFRNIELLQEGPRLNVWRAPLCNETDDWGGQSSRPWYSAGLNVLEHHLLGMEMERGIAEVLVHARTRLSAPEGQTTFLGDYLYRIFPSGDLLVTLNLVPSGPMPAWLPKVGLQMILPEAFDQFRWYGRGPFETYPDRKSGAKFGLYSGTVRGQYVPYLVPQDYGNKTDVRWATLTNQQGIGLLVIPDRPLNVSVQHFRTDNLTRARYPFQLEAGHGITLNIDAAVSGVGETPINTLPKYRTLPLPTAYTVRIKPMDATREDPMSLKNQTWRRVE